MNVREITKLPELISSLIQILRCDRFLSDKPSPEEKIKQVLEKMKGSNIVNFSKIINDCINNNVINFLKQMLDKKGLEEINDIVCFQVEKNRESQ